MSVMLLYRVEYAVILLMPQMTTVMVVCVLRASLVSIQHSTWDIWPWTEDFAMLSLSCANSL